ncbi:hypothetical protein CPB86DRAFT_766960 [Serendipita vermifera]|nr:hypothetical protein CPB86DRAFT_766960 [Serendipita vermifera]
MDPTRKRRMSEASSMESEEEEDMEMGVSRPVVDDIAPPIAMSPTHATGHLTPGHIAGKPLHDSPKHEYVQLPPEIHDTHSHGLMVAEAFTNIGDAHSSVETLVEPLIRPPGAEPGIDPRRESVKKAYAYIKEKCEIEVIDYCAERVKFRQYENASFLEFLKTADRAPPMKVRWINIGASEIPSFIGISWDIISELALKYQLHPLSIEDIIHNRSSRSKASADYYSRHLFVHVLCHALRSKKTSPLQPKYFKDEETDNDESDTTESSESDATDTDDTTEEDTKRALIRRVTRRRRRRKSKTIDTEAIKLQPQQRLGSLKWMESMALLTPDGYRRQAQKAKLEALKKEGRVKVVLSNAFFFLLKDGTLISIHQGDRSFGNQIYQRLRHSDGVLRKEPEASLLLEALLDLIVDQGLEVVDKYGDRINECEEQVLLKPNMQVVRKLHILSADLTATKRTMQPLKSLIYGLRRFDTERTAACFGVAGSDKNPVVGYMSPKTKVYLADVSDHLESIMSSLDQFSTMADNLIDFTFNMNSHATNEQMKRMTILMTVFLPLTLLTGYFGMNFDPMPAVQKHSDILFWQIAVPVMAVILPLALWGDIVKVLRLLGSMRLLTRVEKKQKAKVRSAKRTERKRRQTIEEVRKRKATMEGKA